MAKLPPLTLSSCFCEFFKWRLFIRLPPLSTHDCVNLHRLIFASMIRARHEFCAPLWFPSQIYDFQTSVSSFACCHCLVPCSRCVQLQLALPAGYTCGVDVFVSKIKQQTPKMQKKMNSCVNCLTALLQTSALQQKSEVQAAAQKVLHLVTRGGGGGPQ